MKRFMFLIIVGLLVVTACGKQESKEATNKEKLIQTEKTSNIETSKESKSDFIPISELPKEYPPEMAIANGDVVRANFTEGNLNKLSRFVENVKTKNPDFIRVVITTVEGDPIIQDLDFDGKMIHYSFDNTRDGWGANKGIQSFDFDDFLSRDSSVDAKNFTEFVLVKEGFNDLNVISVPKGYTN